MKPGVQFQKHQTHRIEESKKHCQYDPLSFSRTFISLLSHQAIHLTHCKFSKEKKFLWEQITNIKDEVMHLGLMLLAFVFNYEHIEGIGVAKSLSKVFRLAFL